MNAGDNDDTDGNFTSSKYKTCPHYRQLTTNRTASLAQSMFIPPKEVNCCSQGGEKSKMGLHDIEDLVAFGVNPHVQRGIAIYRDASKGASIGLTLKEESYGTIVNSVKKEGAAATEGSIMENDRIVGVNGKDVASSSLADVSTEIRNATSDPVLLDVSRGQDLTMQGDYSSHAACPYFLSRALSKQAEIIFAPYNYVLDPGIRKSLDIDLEGSIVVLDEAHNVESVLRESGSGTFAEVDLCDMFILLSLYSSMDRSRANLVDIPGSDSNDPEKVDISVAAHTVLLFLERIIMFLRKSRKAFEDNRSKS
jgi:Fanconi anemia group J protein